MLLDLISYESEKIIWNYYHNFNKYEKNIKKILNTCDYDEFIYNEKKSNYSINLLDLLEIYNNNKYDKKIYIKLKNENEIKIKIYNIKNFTIYKEEKDYNKYISYNNFKYLLNDITLNKKIFEIIKFSESNTIYILI